MPPEAGRDEEGSSHRGLEAVRTCQHLDFRLAACRTVRQYISTVWSHPVCAALLWPLQEINTPGIQVGSHAAM